MKSYRRMIQRSAKSEVSRSTRVKLIDRSAQFLYCDTSMKPYVLSRPSNKVLTKQGLNWEHVTFNFTFYGVFTSRSLAFM